MPSAFPRSGPRPRTSELSELGIRNEKAAGLPSIGAFYTNQRNAQRDAFDFFGEGSWYPIQLVGVQMTIPLWSSFAGKERVLQAELTRDRAATALEQLTEAAELEYRAAMSEYTSGPRAAAAGPARARPRHPHPRPHPHQVHRGPVQQL